MPARNKRRKAGKKDSRDATERILGAKAFESISAVEGLALSAAGKKRRKAAKARKMNHAERRAEVVRAYAADKGR